MGIKERCVCDICICGKHVCGPEGTSKKTKGVLNLRNEGDIYIAPKASFEFPDTLNLFEGRQDHKTIANKDFKEHAVGGVERPKPQDQITLSTNKLDGDTVTRTSFPVYDIKPAKYRIQKHHLERNPSDGKIGNGVLVTSYSDHFPAKKSEPNAVNIHTEELERLHDGELDLLTVKQKDYVPFTYGRPNINKIKDSNVMGLGSEEKMVGETSHADQFRTQSRHHLRSSKKRDPVISFGSAVHRDTSYGASYQEKTGGRQSKAKFSDELVLFAGDHHLDSTVRSDYKTHATKGIEKHKPKDTIEIPKEGMAKDTVTLAHFQAPPDGVEKVTIAQQHQSKPFDLDAAMQPHAMNFDTSYKKEFIPKKGELSKVITQKDEIAPNKGDIDFSTNTKADFAKFEYGRPKITKAQDNNILGINYNIGLGRRRSPKSKLKGREDDLSLIVESLPVTPDGVPMVSMETMEDRNMSPPQVVQTKKGELATKFEFGSDGDKGEMKNTTYGGDFKHTSIKTRKTKRRDDTLNFGVDFHGETSYGKEYTRKQCLVPTLSQLDEYTFEGVRNGHKVYKVNCGCPPVGACGCPPPA